MAATGQEGCLRGTARSTGLQGRCMNQDLQTSRSAGQGMMGLFSRTPTLLRRLGVHHQITNHCQPSWQTALNILLQSCRFWTMLKSLLCSARLDLMLTVEQQDSEGLCLAMELAIR